MTYTLGTQCRLPDHGGDTLYLKQSASIPSVSVTDKDGEEFVFSPGLGTLSAITEGECFYQIQRSGQVVASGSFRIGANFALSSGDPRSRARVVLDAIDAQLEGRASAQQRQIKVGDKEIVYSTLDELLQWREYFAKKVAAEEGRASTVRVQKVDFSRHA